MPPNGEKTMHTAICAFDDRARAERARDSLLDAGFARHDVHIEHKELYGEHAAANDRFDSMEREIALDRGVLASFGHFFASLFGRDHPAGHAETYAGHVERGNYVVVVDAHDAADAERARTLLQGLQAGELNLVPRPGQRPLRDIVGTRQEGLRDEGAGLVERSRESVESDFNEPPAGESPSTQRERAMASGVVSPGTGPDLRDPELGRAPGLRYGDKDKPNG
jgi:hypothetical protein